jgi:hypothetical protein
LGDGAVLLLENHETEDDCSIGFLGTPWHGHGGLMFVDSRGYYVDLDYLNLLTGLKDGDILVCEREVDGEIVDRYLMHSRYNNEFRNMPPRERLIVRRAKLPD